MSCRERQAAVQSRKAIAWTHLKFKASWPRAVLTGRNVCHGWDRRRTGPQGLCAFLKAVPQDLQGSTVVHSYGSLSTLNSLSSQHLPYPTTWSGSQETRAANSAKCFCSLEVTAEMSASTSSVTSLSSIAPPESALESLSALHQTDSLFKSSPSAEMPSPWQSRIPL